MTCLHYIPQKDNAGVPSRAPVSLWCRGVSGDWGLYLPVFTVLCVPGCTGGGLNNGEI